MKRLTTTLLVIAIVLCLAATGLLEQLALFVFLGVIPGTTWSVPPLVMLIVLGSALFGTILWTRRQSFYKNMRNRHALATKSTATGKKARPKRRRSSRSNSSPSKRRLARDAQAA